MLYVQTNIQNGASLGVFEMCAKCLSTNSTNCESSRTEIQLCWEKAPHKTYRNPDSHCTNGESPVYLASRYRSPRPWMNMCLSGALFPAQPVRLADHSFPEFAHPRSYPSVFCITRRRHQVDTSNTPFGS